MYSFSELLAAFTAGMIICLVMVLIGGFIERTSFLVEQQRIQKRRNAHHAKCESRFLNKRA
jgi:hypothetical protein